MPTIPASIPSSLAIGVGGSALALGTAAYMLHHRSSSKKFMALRSELFDAVSSNAQMKQELQSVFQYIGEELHKNRRFLEAADALLPVIENTEDLRTQFGGLMAYIVRLSISKAEANERYQHLGM